MVEQCTYSAYWPSNDGEKKDKCNRYRASFGLVPKKGEHMFVYEGKAFSHDDIYGRSVVVKGFRRYCGNNQDCEMYKLCNNHAQNLAKRFNKLLDIKIRFVVSAVTEIEQRAALAIKKKFKKEEAVLFEEKLKGDFTIFVGKRGETGDRCTGSRILEAFCHFSFYASGGNSVICGLKGVQRKHLHEYILTNPTIHSREGRFGPKDKRDAGIEDFKANHICNEFCHMFMSKKQTTEFDNASDEC